MTLAGELILWVFIIGVALVIAIKIEKMIKKKFKIKTEYEKSKQLLNIPEEWKE